MEDYEQLEAQAQTFERIAEISFDDEPDLHSLSIDAERYLLMHRWCEGIVNGWLAVYWEGILAVFLFQIDPTHNGVDKYVWIVIGDIPPAYIDVQSGRNPKEALDSYVLIMSEWVDNIMDGKAVAESYPVAMPPVKENAVMLKKRLDILQDLIEEELD